MKKLQKKEFLKIGVKHLDVLYDLPEEYTNRFLDWIEDTIG